MKKVCSTGLALLLALSLAVPGFASEMVPDPAPEAVESVEPSPAPSETQFPEETNPPEETPMPEETEPPEETPAPVETDPPGETPAPVETDPPEETPAPVETEPPEETPAPVETEPPEETPAPVETDPPGETPAPVETDPPEETPAPVETEPPEETPAPVDASRSDIPIIDVTVPESGRIVINPYGLPVESDHGVSTEQIVGETLTITNHSEVPVTVWASAAGGVTEQSGVIYASEPPGDDAREKELFLYAEFQSEDGEWSGAYQGAEHQILISGQASVMKEVLTLDAGPSHGVFRLFGAASASPEVPWGEEDEISVTFTFTFTAADLPDVILAADPEPTPEPAPEPTPEPTPEPAPEPTPEPAPEPAPEPTPEPAPEPAPEPTPEPDPEPTPEPTPEPAPEPTPESDPEPDPDPNGEIQDAESGPAHSQGAVSGTCFCRNSTACYSRFLMEGCSIPAIRASWAISSALAEEYSPSSRHSIHSRTAWNLIST